MRSVLLNLFQKKWIWRILQQQQRQQNKSVDKKHCIINISWLLKGTPIHESLHNTTLTWAAFENNPLIDWPMNFIQEWGKFFFYVMFMFIFCLLYVICLCFCYFCFFIFLFFVLAFPGAHCNAIIARARTWRYCLCVLIWRDHWDPSDP